MNILHIEAPKRSRNGSRHGPSRGSLRPGRSQDRRQRRAFWGRGVCGVAARNRSWQRVPVGGAPTPADQRWCDRGPWQEDRQRNRIFEVRR